tara:strand:+ start:3313 stop:4545 length:1233 start_codon:yes stop_codon:yes gene_type:complete
MKRNFQNFRVQARKLLFEDTYSLYSDQDNQRAGTQFEEPETADPYEPPITVNPQMATQLSVDEPPVDDPEYAPVNSKELAKAVAVLAQRLPDEVAELTYDKFEKYVVDNENAGIEVVEDENQVAEEAEEDSEVNEARKLVKTALWRHLIAEGDWSQFRLGRHDDDEDLGEEGSYSEVDPTEDDLDTIESGGGMSFEDLAQEIPGVSGPSGAKQTINRILKKMETLAKHFPDDVDEIRPVARKAFVEGSLDLGLFEQEDVSEVGIDSPMWEKLDAFRTFMDAGFILPAHQSLLRDMGKEVRKNISSSDLDPLIHEMVFNQAVGNSPVSPRKIGLKLQRKNPDMSMEERDAEVKKASVLVRKLASQQEDLGSLSPGLAERALSSWDGKSNSRQLKILSDAWADAADFQAGDQ